MNKYFKAITANELYLAANTVAFLILTPFAIRIMGSEFYGLWSVLYSVMLFSGIGSLGIGTIVNKFGAEFAEEPGERHNGSIVLHASLIILPMGILTAAVLWAAAGLIATRMNVSPEMQLQFIKGIRLCAIGIIPQFLADIPQGYMLSQYKNKFVRIMDFLGNTLPWLGAILVSLVVKDLALIALWFVFLQVLLLVIYVLAIRKDINLKSSPQLNIIKRMLGYSGFMFIESTAVALFQQFDKVIVAFVLGPVIAGIYSVGTSISLRISMATGQITAVMLPYASRKNSVGDEDKLFSTYSKLLRYVSWLVAGMGSLMILWMHEVLSVWISASYADQNSAIFSIFIIAYGVISLSRPAHQTLQGIGKVKFSSLVYLASSILMLAGVYLLSKRFGFAGAASANAILALVLIMNLRVYKLANGRIGLAELLLIPLPGILIPLIVFIAIKLLPMLIFKAALTFILVVVLVVLIRRDPFVRAQLLKFFNRQAETLNS